MLTSRATPAGSCGRWRMPTAPPQIAAIKFYEALKKVPGWEALPVTVAAQKVQVSLYPDAYADDDGICRRHVQAC